MSGSVNIATLIGNVGKAPEVARLQSGKPVVKFSLATSETWKDKNGERQERTTWHNIVIFQEGLCKVVEQYVDKGSKVFIQGSISNRSYEKNGQKVYVSEVCLQGFDSKLVLLNGRKDGDYSSPPATGNQYAKESQGFHPDLNDDVPFIMEWR